MTSSRKSGPNVPPKYPKPYRIFTSSEVEGPLKDSSDRQELLKVDESSALAEALHEEGAAAAGV